ncbi:M20 family metallopeptidase [Roseomonas sp. 18066]|uniref:M20 metallopeptidase family protein n=1 Tax=Roseomonas sp. 18066 TaxID=2681412 RepID=UPI0013579757|nr:M20 family metallopeptidase [Roseomonas sp. 18066]
MSQPDLPNDPGPSLRARVAAIEPALTAIRRDLHAHPELGFETVRTAGIVADELRRLGLAPRTGIGRTGVVAEIEGGAPGPCLLIRADMDALPMQELTGLPYASSIPGRMHACGHDLHTATLLGVAAALLAEAPRLRGSIRLVFQPAEETSESGAEAMIADGAADGADMALTLHNRPEMPVGSFGLTQGASTAACDDFEVTVRGTSGHAARPHAAADPIVAAALMVAGLQTVISREMNPAESAVLTVGHIAGGSTHNIIPDSCLFRGTVRSRSPAARDRAEAGLRRVCQGVALAQNVAVDIDYLRGVPPLMNDPALVARAMQSLAAQFGTAPRLEPGRSFGAEDFSYFTERMPGLQLYVGAGQPGRDDRVHNSNYQPDEGSIGLGATALARLAVDLLS